MSRCGGVLVTKSNRPQNTQSDYQRALVIKSQKHSLLLLSAKLQNDTISLTAMPINSRCELLFWKSKSCFPTIIHRLTAKKALAKNRKRGTLDEVRRINLFSGGLNDKFVAPKLLSDSNKLFIYSRYSCKKRTFCNASYEV